MNLMLFLQTLLTEITILFGIVWWCSKKFQYSFRKFIARIWITVEGFTLVPHRGLTVHIWFIIGSLIQEPIQLAVHECPNNWCLSLLLVLYHLVDLTDATFIVDRALCVNNFLLIFLAIFLLSWIKIESNNLLGYFKIIHRNHFINLWLGLMLWAHRFLAALLECVARSWCGN